MKVKQYLVFGLGRFGSSLARALCAQGQEALAVDSDQELVNQIAPHVTQALQLDATDEEALRSLGVQNFDAAVVAIGQNTRDSILICVLLKEMGIPYLIAKANDDLHAKVLRKIGVDRVVFPERDMGVRLARSIITPSVLDLMELSGDYQLAEILLPAGWEGESLRSADVRRKYGVNLRPPGGPLSGGPRPGHALPDRRYPAGDGPPGGCGKAAQVSRKKVFFQKREQIPLLLSSYI